MNDGHDKLQLTKQDLKMIYNEMLSNILPKIELHLPNEDEFRVKVTNSLHDYLMAVFEDAKYGMIIDGMDMSRSSISIQELLSIKPKEKTEQFDFELNNQLRSILQQMEQETIEVTKLRKQIPKDIKSIYDNIISTTDVEVSKALAELNDDDPSSSGISSVTLPDDASQQQLIKDYDQHLVQLHQLKELIPQQASELDKLNDIILFLQKKYDSDE